MFLVAACPGGNISNFMTSFAKGNTELSVGLSASTTLLATFSTPFTLHYGAVYISGLSAIKQVNYCSFAIDNLQMFETVFILLGIPLILGIFFARYFP